MPKRRSRPLRAAAISIALALVAAVGGYLVFHHVTLTQSGCESGGRRAVALDTDQAAIAATIAGVAHARRLPAGAVTIAYATAMQESHLHNLRYGDLDSIGVFQQRPSQGWGSRRHLADPVYATGKFFAALVKVPDYLRIPLYQAAQDVQHSADGSAYQNYQQQAASMSGAFTGGLPHAVWCWFAAGSRDRRTSGRCGGSCCARSGRWTCGRPGPGRLARSGDGRSRRASRGGLGGGKLAGNARRDLPDQQRALCRLPMEPDGWPPGLDAG